MERTKTQCEKCSQMISRSNFNKHNVSCDGSINYWSKKRAGLTTVDHGIECKFCAKIHKNSNSRRNHERLCQHNPDRQSTTFQTNRDKVNESKQNYSNQFTKARFLGGPVPVVSNETKKKLSDIALKRHQDPAYRKQIAEKISVTVSNKLIEGSWHTYSDVKKIEYKNTKFDSSWEVKYAQWLDARDIPWERCRQKFTYTYNGILKHYTPDFYLPNSNEYIEIKGYEIDKDHAKWMQFPATHKLTVLREQDLKVLKII